MSQDHVHLSERIDDVQGVDGDDAGPGDLLVMITNPPSERNTIWFAAPVTATAWPSMTSAWIWACPLTAAPTAAQTATTRDMTKSA